MATFLKNPDLAVVGNVSAVGATFTTVSTTTANISNAIIGNVAINGNVISSTNGVLQLAGNAAIGNVSVGIATANSATISGNVLAGNISATSASFSIIAATGVVTLGPITNVKITGGGAGNVVFTDGAGNLSFGNIAAVVSGNAIPLGANTVGNLSSAVNVTNYTVTDAIASLNQFLGNITSIRGASTGILYATNIYGQLANASQPLITTLANVTIGNIITSNIYLANGAPLISTVIASSPNLAGANAAILAANIYNTTYTSTLNAAMAANVNGANTAIISNVAILNANIAGANAAIITANNAVVGYVNTLNLSMVSNITAANAAIAFVSTSNNNTVTYVNNLNAAMASNVAGANAAIVTANNAVVGYVNSMNTAMIANIAGVNANIVTANNAVVSYVNVLNANTTAYINAADAAINAINANIASFESYANVTFISGKVTSIYAPIGNVLVTIDSFNSRTYTTVEYVIQATYQTNFGATKDVETVDLLVITNGTTVLQTEYAALSTNGLLFSPSATISNGIVTVGVTPIYGNITLDVIRTQVVSRL